MILTSWARAAERTTFSGTLDDGNTVAGSLAHLRALLCRDGPGQMRRDALDALAGLGPLSPYRPAMVHATGPAGLRFALWHHTGDAHHAAAVTTAAAQRQW
jgi:hypothetical protein